VEIYKLWRSSLHIGFPHSSDGKETTCNTGDLGLIPGLGRSSEKKKKNGYPLQYFCLDNSTNREDW